MLVNPPPVRVGDFFGGGLGAKRVGVDFSVFLFTIYFKDI